MNRLNFVLLIILFILAATEVSGFRIARPQTLTLPLTQDQVNQLNDTLQRLWSLQNGEFNLDIVTTAKTNAQNGDFWLIYTSPTVRFQYKAQNRVWTITPDGT